MKKEELEIFSIKMFLEWLFMLIIFGIGPLALAKGYFFKNYKKIISVLKLRYANKKLLKHDTLRLLDSFSKSQDDLIHEWAEVEKLAQIIARVEVRFFRVLIRSTIKYAIIENKKLTLEKFVKYFENEYIKANEVIEIVIERRIDNEAFWNEYKNFAFVYNKAVRTLIGGMKKFDSVYDALEFMLNFFLSTSSHTKQQLLFS